jgi:hypothetical protein
VQLRMGTARLPGSWQTEMVQVHVSSDLEATLGVLNPGVGALVVLTALPG